MIVFFKNVKKTQQEISHQPMFCYSSLFPLLFMKIIVDLDQNKNFQSATIGF